MSSHIISDLTLGISLARVAEVILIRRAERLKPRSPAGGAFLHTLSEIIAAGADIAEALREAEDTDTLPVPPSAPATPSSVE